MHRNENKYDQLFRNRLRDLTHPVRNELWSRIHSGIKVPKTSVPRQPPGNSWSTLAQKLSLLRSAVSSNGLSSLTVAGASVLAITIGIIYFTHTVTPPSAGSAKHYSTTMPAITPAQSTGKSSVTPRDSSGDHLDKSVTATNIRVIRVPAAPGTTVTSPNLTPENITRAGNRRNHLSPQDRTGSGHHHHTSAATETMPGTPGIGEIAATSGRQTIGKLSVDRHNPVTLPSLALTGNRAAIVAGTPGSKSPHNSSIVPAKAPHFQRTGYVSFYGSADFPNHYYTWSNTLGFRATLQFSPRWSFTAGLEYARVNVPTQVVPPVGYGDTLHSFYFSNYEVPVLFGYTRTFRRSTLTVNGGAILNLYFHRSTGVWVFNWPDRDSYGAVLGVDYTRPVGRHLAIFVQPYARYSISNYRMFIQAQRWSFGTLLGMKYQL